MAPERFRANDTPLPTETLAEIHDGLALALDTLNAGNVRRAAIAEATGHLRWAMRRANTLLAGGEAGQ